MCARASTLFDPVSRAQRTRAGASLVPPGGSFAFALALASVLHLVAVFALGVQLPKPVQPAREALEILILRQAAPRSVPDEAKALAQVDRRGTGAGEGARQLPRQDAGVDPGAVEPSPAQEAKPQQEPAAQPAAEPGSSAPSGPTALTLPEPGPSPFAEPPRRPVDATQILDSRSAEIARLTREVVARSAALANRPRRKAVSASTREYKYASYLEAWRRKVERIGNLNYPEIAKERKLHGNLILHVAVRADGEVERIRVLRSSGYPELDQSAVKIVKLAAPFAPFPPDIRAETDILDITRTWQFLDDNRLGWDK